MSEHIYIKVIHTHGAPTLIGSWLPPTELNDNWNAQKDIGWHVCHALFQGVKSVEVKLGDMDKEEPYEPNKQDELEHIADDLSQANETIRTLLKDALDRAPWPPCMAPDGAEPCAHYQALTDQLENYREKAVALNRYLHDKNFSAIEAVIVEFSLLAEKKA